MLWRFLIFQLFRLLQDFCYRPPVGVVAAKESDKRITTAASVGQLGPIKDHQPTEQKEVRDWERCGALD